MYEAPVHQPIPISEHPGEAESEIRDIDTSVYAWESNPRGFMRVKESEGVTSGVTLPLNDGR